MPRVLIVDDSASIRSVVKVFLKEFSFTFEDAVDGTQGLQAARTNPPDLIISDVQMPGLTGPELLAELRKDDRFKKTPVIVLTGASEGEVVDIQTNSETFLTRKPVKSDELKRVVREALAMG